MISINDVFSAHAGMVLGRVPRRAKGGVFPRTRGWSGNGGRRDILAILTERFALPFDDARLVLDRVMAGVVRAASGNPANEPDPVKDPLAWMSYRLGLGLLVDDDDKDVVVGPSIEGRASTEALLERARRGELTYGSEDFAVALEVARLAVASQESGRTRFRLLLEVATPLSVAVEACIVRLGAEAARGHRRLLPMRRSGRPAGAAWPGSRRSPSRSPAAA